MILAGDIGGTHTRLALFERGQLVGVEEKFPSPQFGSLEEIVLRFLKGKRVEKACFGVAGPVQEGRSKITNLPWVIDATRLAQAMGMAQVHLLNDLEANAYGIKVLKPSHFYVLQEGRKQKGNQALIAAGTGLGEAGLFWDGKEHCPFACEGGHTDLAPRNELEVELLFYLKEKFDHVSYERVVSGPGIHSLFAFLVERKGRTVAPEVKRAMETQDPSRAITERVGKDPVCTEAVDWFISLYGAEAGNLALKFLSLGGLFIGGGIAPHLVERIKRGGFVSAFLQKGRFKALLESIPISIILNDHAALLGAAYYAETR